MIISPVFKKNLLRVAGGADHQQDPNNTFGSLKATMSANPATMEAFRVSSVMVVPVEGPFTVSKK